MKIISTAETEASLDYPGLIEALRDMFRSGCELPLRHHHPFKTPGDEPDGMLLIMPAWQVGGHIGIKTLTVLPGNNARGLPSIMGTYMLIDATDGTPLALMDAKELTVRRTAAASALAADYLAAKDASDMLMVGAGALAPHLVRAHATVRPLKRITVWNRNHEKAVALAAQLAGEGFNVTASQDLEGAARAADLISCATLSKVPLIKGDWLKAGSHLDLVGAFTPEMRECDDEAVRRARVYVDTHEGGRKEAGDIVQALKSGALAEDEIVADLFELTRGEKAGRTGADEITLFKSVGTALEDLAAAIRVLEKA